MTISTYSELKTAITSNWANRTDLSARVGEFITLAEAKFNRRLRTVEMETAMTETAISSGVIARPADMVAIKAIWRTNDQKELTARTLQQIMQAASTADPPLEYAWSGANLAFNHTGGSVAAVYYAKVPALSDSNTTNWLLTDSPDLYLWAGLEQTAIYLRDEVGVAFFGAKCDGLIEELNSVSTAKQYAGKLVARHR